MARPREGGRLRRIRPRAQRLANNCVMHLAAGLVARRRGALPLASYLFARRPLWFGGGRPRRPKRPPRFAQVFTINKSHLDCKLRRSASRSHSRLLARDEAGRRPRFQPLIWPAGRAPESIFVGGGGGQSAQVSPSDRNGAGRASRRAERERGAAPNFSGARGEPFFRARPASGA